jgi:hypothetical protein
MASVARVGYLLIDGQQYKVSRNGDQSSLQRSHQAIEPSQLSGLRVQPPFLSSETQGFENGEGLRSRDDVAVGYYGGLGVEPYNEVPTSGHLRLKVGRQLTQKASQASAGGFRAMMVFNNLLYLASASQAKLYTWDGTTLTALDYSATINSPATSFAFPPDVVGRVYFATMSGGIYVLTTSTGTFALFSGPTINAVSGAFLAGTWQTLPAGDDIFWFTSEDAGGGNGALYSYAGGVRTTLHAVFNLRMIAPIIIGETVYYWVYDAVSTRQPRAELYTHSAASTTGGPTAMGVRIIDNYPVSACAYRGELYVGMAWGGSVRKLTGGALEEILHVGTTVPPATVPGTDAIYALAVYNDSLYAAGYDASAPSGQRTWLRRYNGTGWHTISVGGNDLSTAIRALGVFEQTIVLGDQEATDARLYSLDTALRLTSARLDTADALYGSTGVPKRFVSVSLQHSPLVAGQAVELRYVLDDGAEVSVGTNRDVGSTVTTFALPTTVRGTKLRPRWYFTNVSGADLIITGDSIVALPAPPSREVWQADLQLAADAYDAADTRTELDRYTALQTLQDTGAIFQVVHEYRDANGLPLLAMRAAFDPQVPLETRDVGIGGGLMSAVAPVRLVQAASPTNLLVNASFEQDVAPSAPTGWGTTGSGTSSNASISVTPPDGGQSLAIVFNGASATYGRTQTVSGLVPGRYYTLSGSIRRATTGAGNVKLNAFESGILDVSTTALAAATDAGFTRYSVTFLLPLTSSGTISVRLLGSNTPAGTAYFDAIQLEEGAPASPFRELGSGN